MGAKRRENYDSWWRCRVDFDPCLDEWFGITFTKQQICPTQMLVDLLSPDLEAIGRSLNAGRESVRTREDCGPVKTG